MTPGMADAHATARERDAYRTRTHAIDPTTGEFTRLDQESDTMTDPIDHRAEAERIRDDERRVVKPSGTRMDGAIVHALLAIHDTLRSSLDRISDEQAEQTATLHAIRDRMPLRAEPAPLESCDAWQHDDETGECEVCGPSAPAPADDLPGEPVEPGDLRAGDRVAFTYAGTRCSGALVSDGAVLRSDTADPDGCCIPAVVQEDGEWAGGISDVRLIERAPREDEDPDEALARVIFGDAYGSHEGLRLAQLDVALMAREHIEAERGGALHAVADAARRNHAAFEEAQARAIKAEAERDALRERLLRLRADLSPGGLIWTVDAALRRDDERAAKGERR